MTAKVKKSRSSDFFIEMPARIWFTDFGVNVE